MEEIKKGSIKELVDIIGRTNDTFAYSIYVPSLNREVLFREMTTAQQKKLVKSVIDSPVFNTEFIFALREIIRENCTDTSINVDELTIYDKLIIAVTMRSMSVSNELNLNLKCESCEKIQPYQVKLDALLNVIKDTVNLKTEDIITDENNTFRIHCKIPNISTEFKLESEFRKNTKLKIEDESELRETLGNVFISEIVKYINKLEVLDKDSGNMIEIDLETLNFANRVKLIEKINIKLMKKVIDFIFNIKKEFDKIVLVKANCNCNSSSVLSQRFSIDSNFFILS